MSHWNVGKKEEFSLLINHQ